MSDCLQLHLNPSKFKMPKTNQNPQEPEKFGHSIWAASRTVPQPSHTRWSTAQITILDKRKSTNAVESKLKPSTMMANLIIYYKTVDTFRKTHAFFLAG